MKEYATSKKTRRNLIDATGNIAAETGFTNVSMRAVAKRAGENIGSIHYHFGNKSNLFKEVIKEALKIWTDDPLGRYTIQPLLVSTSSYVKPPFFLSTLAILR